MKNLSTIAAAISLTLCLLFATFPGTVCGGVISVNPTGDSRIVSAAPNSPQGTTSILSVYNDGGGNVQRTVALFDISTIPAGASIVSATLQLTADSGIYGGGQTAGEQSEVYRVTASWVETDATWNERAAATSWTTAGGDYVGTTGLPNVSPYAINTTLVPDGYSGTVNLTWDVTTLVSQWQDGTYSNLGLLLLGTVGDQLHFDSREIGIALNRPLLTVEFAPVPEPSTFALLGLGAIGLAIRSRRRIAA